MESLAGNRYLARSNIVFRDDRLEFNSIYPQFNNLSVGCALEQKTKIRPR